MSVYQPKTYWTPCSISWSRSSCACVMAHSLIGFRSSLASPRRMSRFLCAVTTVFRFEGGFVRTCRSRGPPWGRATAWVRRGSATGARGEDGATADPAVVQVVEGGDGVL